MPQRSRKRERTSPANFEAQIEGLGKTARRVSAWVAERGQMITELTRLRDTASDLINELTGGGARRAAAVRTARRKPGRKKGTKLSAAARAKMSRAAKKRWAAKKKASNA